MRAQRVHVLMIIAIISTLVVWYQYRKTQLHFLLDIQTKLKGIVLQYDAQPQILASSANRTSHDARLLVYNRVYQCGSSTLIAILTRLSKLNNFKHNSSNIYYGQLQLTEDQERTFIEDQERKLLKHPNKAISFDRHVYFINFTRYNVSRPIYINLLRDPVSTFVSNFYYDRSPERWDKILNTEQHPADLELLLKKQREEYPQLDQDPQSRQLVLPINEWLYKSLEDCVISGDPECNFESENEKKTFVAFLCGSQPFCSIMKNKAALQQAKLNVEREYSVVGILEHLNVSLGVMEAYIPRYFAGVQEAYVHVVNYDLLESIPHIEPSPKVRAILMDTLSDDMELYEFARQRLFLQQAAIPVKQSLTSVQND